MTQNEIRRRLDRLETQLPAAAPAVRESIADRIDRLTAEDSREYEMFGFISYDPADALHAHLCELANALLRGQPGKEAAAALPSISPTGAMPNEP